MATLSESESAADFVDQPNFAVLSTLQPDGSPQSSVVWIDRDGDDVLFSTVEGRQKHTNIEHDPRVSLLVLDGRNYYRYLEVRGSVQMTTAGGTDLIDGLALKYRGSERFTPDDDTDHVRVVCRLTPSSIVLHG